MEYFNDTCGHHATGGLPGARFSFDLETACPSLCSVSCATLAIRSMIITNSIITVSRFSSTQSKMDKVSLSLTSLFYVMLHTRGITEDERFFQCPLFLAKIAIRMFLPYS
jgi:hypothetical protein